MNVKIMMHAAFLCNFSFVYCMELQQQKINYNKNQTTLQLDNSLIQGLIINIKKNKSNPLIFYQQTKRLNLLRQLLEKKTVITFNHQDDNIRFWLNKNETKIVQGILYDKLLALLCYRATFQKNIVIAHAPSKEKKSFAISLQINNSLLHFTAQLLNHDIEYILKKFLREYDPTIEDISKPLARTQQQQKTHQYFDHAQDATTKYQSLQLPKEEQDLLITLPHNTQELLMDILLDRNNFLNNDNL